MNDTMRMTLFGKRTRWLVIAFALVAMVLALAAWPGAAQADTTHYIAFTSDVHGRTDNLQTWLDKLKNTTTTIDCMVFGGDYAATDSQAWAKAQECESIVSNKFGKPSVLVKGNHDINGTYPTGLVDLVYDGGDYKIYVLDNSSSSFTTAAINALDTTLAGIDPSIPVFIAEHCPIHYYSGRTTTNASAFLTMVNKYPNAIVLWGHNHTISDPGYGTVKKAEDKLVLTRGGSEVAINFTYASFGAMKEGAGKNTYGMLATLTSGASGTTIDFAYKNLSGATVGSTYSVTIPKGTSPPTTGVKPGTSPVAVSNTNQTSITSNSVSVAKDTLVLVTVAWSSGTTGAAKTITGITFGGQALTLSKGKTFDGDGASGGKRSVGIYPFIVPAGMTSGTAKVTFSGATSFSIVNVETFTGVDPANPLGAFSAGKTGKSGLPSETLTGLKGDELVVDLMYQAPHSSYMGLGTGQTLLWQGASGSTNRAQSSYKPANGATSVTMNWTFDPLPSSHSWTILAVPIKPAAAGEPPVVGDIPDQTINEGEAFATINLDDYVTDPDNDKSEINWTYSGNSELGVNISSSRVATITIPHPDWFGSETITFKATDPSGLHDEDSATFTVLNVNDDPVAVDDTATTSVNTLVNIAVLANDSDVDGDTLTVTGVSDPPFGTATIKANNTIDYTPDPGYVGTDSFTYTISDGHGGTASATVTVTITAPSTSVTPGTSPAAVVNTSASSTITSNSVTVAKDTLVLVTVVWSSGTSGAAKTITGITFGGQALTLSKGKTFDGTGSSGGYRSVGIYPFIAPSAISNGKAVVTFSAATEFSILNVETFTGVDPTTPLGTFSAGATHKDGSQLPSQTLTGLAGNELVVDLMYQAPHSSYMTPGAGQTVLWQGVRSTNYRAQSSYKPANGASSVIMNWTFGSLPSSHSWTILAVPIKPAASTSTQTLTMAVSPEGAGTTVPAAGATYTYMKDSSVAIQATAAAGYHFVSWSGDVTDPGSASTTVVMDGDKTVTANFEADVVTFTVTYDGNEATGGTVPTDSKTYLEGATVTVLGNTGDLERTGYSFSGWNTKDDGTGDTYQADDTFPMGSANVTLYAKWTALPTFTLTYTAGEGGYIQGPTPQTDIPYGGSGVEVTAVANSGYHFLKWSDDLLTASRTDSNVTADLEVTAYFEADSVTPVLTVTSPNGGESWANGTKQDLTWTLSAPLSEGEFGAWLVGGDGSQPGDWIEVAFPVAAEAGKTTYTIKDWTVSAPARSDYKLGVFYRTDTGVWSWPLWDYSDATFTVTGGPPVLTVTSPNGGESWANGTKQDLTWTLSAPLSEGEFGAWLVGGDGSQPGDWIEVAFPVAAEAGKTTYTIKDWTVSAPARSDYKLGVFYRTDTGVWSWPLWDYSDATFTVTGGPPVLTVTSPNGGESWANGTKQDLTWTLSAPLSEGEFGAWLVGGDGSQPGDWIEVAFPVAAEAGKTTYTIKDWTVSAPARSDYKLGVFYRTDTGVWSWPLWDYSDATFTVTGGPPVLTVTSPNGGESWANGTKQDLTWTLSAPLSEGEFGAWLVGGDGSQPGDWIEVAFPVAAEAGKTTYTIKDWTVSAPARSDYKLGVFYRTDTGVWSWPLWDYSDATFTVSALP